MSQYTESLEIVLDLANSESTRRSFAHPVDRLNRARYHNQQAAIKKVKRLIPLLDE